MSTKATLASGRKFHLYMEAWDDDATWLTIEGDRFEVNERGATLRIPIAIWEYILRSAHRDGDVIDFEFRGRVGRDHLNYAIAVSIPAEALGRPREEFGRSIVADTKEGQEIIAAAKAGRSASERLNALSSRLGEVRALLKWSDDNVVRNPARDWWSQGVILLRRAGYGTEAAQLEDLARKLVGPKWRYAAGSDSDRHRAVELATGALDDAKRTVQDAQEFERVVRRVDEILSKVQ